MKNSIVKTEMIQPLMNVARRYSTMPEYATFASAFVLLLAARQGIRFPLPNLDAILDEAEDIPLYVRSFIKETIGGHWREYQQAVGAFDEESLSDFFAVESVALLMSAREDVSVHPVIDTLCAALLDIKKGDEVADLNCGIGKFVCKAWFSLWNANGSDKGLRVSGYSENKTLAAVSWIGCHVAGVRAEIINNSIFSPTNSRYDKVLVIPPFGCEVRQLNIIEVAESLSKKFNSFPEVRLSSAEWLFAARAATLLKDGGRAIAVMPMNILNGGLSKVYREHLIRNQMIEAVISIPAKYFMNGTGIALSLVVLSDGKKEIKFVNGEEYLKDVAESVSIDVESLLKDYHNLNDFESVTTRPLDKICENDFILTPDFYLGEDFEYNNSRPFGELVGEIRRGAKLSIAEWKKYETTADTPVKKVAFKNFSEGLIDEALPCLMEIPEGASDAVLEDGDLIISRMGMPFKIAVVQVSEGETLVADENVWICRMHGDKTQSYFLRAFLESQKGAKWMSRLSAGATLRTISAKNLTKIPVPEFDEKTRAVIAEELEKNTILVRENRKRLNESLHSMKNVYNEFNKNGGF
ncbi:MAG: N-6 DNA methylase [Kiritimatiellae bacterium]|nr:N-6 DNA methylase [Kiritimatiellia bacterium]